MPEQMSGLQIVFAIFLGLIVASFVGVGVYTFYPSPAERFSDRLRDLGRQQQAISNFRLPSGLTAEDQTRLRALNEEMACTQDAMPRGQ